jgi:alkylmercury lyase
MSATADIAALADELRASFPALSEEQRRTARALARLLAHGTAVAPEDLARASDLPPHQVSSALDRWPAIDRDGLGRVRGFGLLTLEPTQHAVEIDGSTLYAWCALDTLIVPALLERAVRVRSSAPSGGQPVRLTVGPDGVRQAEPAAAVMSLVRPRERLRDDVRGRFCCFVHFFPSEQAGREWTERVAGAFVVPLHDAALLARVLAKRLFAAGA